MLTAVADQGGDGNEKENRHGALNATDPQTYSGSKC